MSGIFYRIERDGKYQAVDISDMKQWELLDAMNTLDDKQLLAMAKIIIESADRDELMCMIDAYRGAYE